ncbi:MAG: hypothetical protein A2X49_07155 [Lentisphaerae bacterium GWF2_52_8]|nr:MAG: hypothetical protein A2X49_07155 [Lentisphaerae bacterium GWF2_52_8]
MNITRQESDGILTLGFNGRLDASTSPNADTELAKSLEKNSCKLLLDMRGLEYISSAGLRILLVAAKKAQQKHGQIAICGLKDTVKDVFDLSGFSSIFKIFANPEEGAVFLKSN